MTQPGTKTSIIILSKYLESIQGYQKKNLEKYKRGNIIKTLFKVDLPFNTCWFQNEMSA